MRERVCRFLFFTVVKRRDCKINPCYVAHVDWGLVNFVKPCLCSKLAFTLCTGHCRVYTEINATLNITADRDGISFGYMSETQHAGAQKTCRA